MSFIGNLIILFLRRLNLIIIAVKLCFWFDLAF